jgi:hypothetical protein
MMNRYCNWTRRQVSSAQCSPAFGFVVIALGLAVTIYMYRRIILDTLEVAGLATLGLGLATGLIFAIVKAFSWQTHRAPASVPGAVIYPATTVASSTGFSTVESPTSFTVPVGDVVEGNVVPAVLGDNMQPVADAKPLDPISAEADWLAEAGTELVFASDGSLVAKTPR